MRRTIIFTLIFAVCGIFLPFDYISTMGASGLFKGFLGNFFCILTVQFLIPCILISTFIISKNPNKPSINLLIFVILFVLLGFYDIITTFFFNNNYYFACSQFLFGFLAPAIIVYSISLQDFNLKLTFFRFFYFGYCCYLFIALIILIKSEFIYYLIESYGFGGALIAIRYYNFDNDFIWFLGNSNKQSNYLILLIAIGPYLLNLDLHDKCNLILYRIFTFFSTIILILLFSRLAILLLPIILLLNRNFIINIDKKIIKLILYSIIVLLFFCYSEYLSIPYDYLLSSTYLDGRSEGVFGTFSGRLLQWEGIFDYYSTFDLIAGMGVGEYGNSIGCPECGTHNLFLDTLLSGGVLSFLLLIILFILIFLRFYLISDYRLIFIFTIFLVMCFREYSFSYLYTTSMGGFLFCLFFYLGSPLSRCRNK